jgi:aspartyl-tRNA(Asn)/glutamyl-tRNA(Gln) amidotransferase subunit C
MPPNTSDEITPEVFKYLVDLASFELEPENQEYLRKQLNAQLKSIHELAEIPLSEDIPASLHGVEYPKQNRPPIREDQPNPFDAIQELTGQIPQFEDGYVVVPDIPHQTLE